MQMKTKSNRKKALEANFGGFKKEYKRKSQKGTEPNDRQYDRAFEQKVKKLSPEEFNDLLHGENDENNNDKDELIDRGYR